VSDFLVESHTLTFLYCNYVNALWAKPQSLCLHPGNTVWPADIFLSADERMPCSRQHGRTSENSGRRTQFRDNYDASRFLSAHPHILLFALMGFRTVWRYGRRTMRPEFPFHKS